MRARSLASVLVAASKLALAASLSIGAACTSARERIDPRFEADLRAVEQALVDRDEARARELLDALEARKPTGAARQRVAQLDAALTEREFAPYAATFEALEAARRDRDSVVARRVLERLQKSGAPASVLEQAAAYERIVAGREIVAGLDLHLAAKLLPDNLGEPNVYAVVLRASHAGDAPVRLQVPSGSLSFLATGVDPSGIERRSAVNRFVDVLAHVELAPHTEHEIALGRFSLAVGGLIAARGRWELALNAGTLTTGARELPAMHVVVAPCEVVRLDPRLPTGAVEPAELLRYVEAGAPSIAALLERAVRVENSRRNEALETLMPAALELDDETLKRIVPALRWLGGERDLGGDPRAWRLWLNRRLAARMDRPSGRRDGLEAFEALAARRP